MPHTLIFDIGKTNKKAFLFDANYQVVKKVYTRFEEQQDEDDFPCDDLSAIQKWIQETLHSVLTVEQYDIQAINFSTYGASFVHLDQKGNPLTTLYNYLKPIPKKVIHQFYKKYGSEIQIAQETASPPLAMLNSGLQLYWLKYTQPKVFKKIRWSLHFPQYLSYLITGIPVSEYTSIGCHTALWDFSKKDYHNWVYAEAMDLILPPIVSTNTSINTTLFDQKLKVGIGIHDSSAALLPYIRADKKPFLLISTGTWSISLNPFNKDLLTNEELEKDCLNFMRTNGQPVKAARLFLGAEYKLQVEQLQTFFGEKNGAHKKVKFNKEWRQENRQMKIGNFRFKYLKTPWQQPKKSQFQGFPNFTIAYHALMREFVQLQIEAANLAIGNTPISKIYIDGGFADNEVFVNLLKQAYKGVKIRTTQSPLGSAFGAAVVMADKVLKKRFLKKNYALRKI